MAVQCEVPFQNDTAFAENVIVRRRAAKLGKHMEEKLSDDELDKISTEILDELTRRIPVWTLCAIRYLTLVDLQNKCRDDAMRQTMADMGKILAKISKNPVDEIDDIERVQMALDRNRMEDGWKALLALVKALSDKEGPPPKPSSSIRWF